MDDLEITRLCARAAGVIVRETTAFPLGAHLVRPNGDLYDPLHNRAQALELVERLRLDIYPFGAEHEKRWTVSIFDKTLRDFFAATHPNLLRAIALCAARVQQSKESQK